MVWSACWCDCQSEDSRHLHRSFDSIRFRSSSLRVNLNRYLVGVQVKSIWWVIQFSIRFFLSSFERNFQYFWANSASGYNWIIRYSWDFAENSLVILKLLLWWVVDFDYSNMIFAEFKNKLGWTIHSEIERAPIQFEFNHRKCIQCDFQIQTYGQAKPEQCYQTVYM